MARAMWLGGALALSLALSGSLAWAQPASGPTTVNVVPEPLSVEAAAGPGLRIADGVPIVAPAGDAQAVATARYLSDLLKRTRGLSLPVQAGGSAPASGPAIFLRRAAAPTGEGYGLEIANGRATITAAGDPGLFYGAVTLWQLASAEGARGAAQLAPVRIADAPRFGWRGLMIDSARHFQPPAEIERLLDAMALHKLNVLHWHLTDDQGWRLEIKKYPQLTAAGAWRTPQPGSPDGAARYGGFYTQDQVRRIVAYAAARHITIVPEIETPGHAAAALRAYPQFGAGGPPPASAQLRWGIFPYVYSPSDATFVFLQDVLTEVMALFPGRYIHVGGDEVAHERWNASPEAQARLRALGTTDPAALQADFTHRLGVFLQAHGRRLVGWDEILAGELPADAVVTSWHGVAGGLAAAAKGHDAVIAPAPTLYFDNRQGESPAEPPGRGTLVRLQDVYGVEPAPPTMSPEAAGHILGLQGNVWTEHIRTSEQLEAMIFPRISAVAEIGWTQPGRKDWAGFVRRIPAQFARYRALGLHADPAALSVLVTPAGGGAVALSSQVAGEIRYTLDGSEPGPASSLYAVPVAGAGPLRAALFLDGVRVGPVAERSMEAAGLGARASQELRLCNQNLALNLEGAPGPDRRTYLTNPADSCWIYGGAELDHADQLRVSFERLPFNFSLGASYNTVVARPPRTPAGELEVRQDTCLADPLAVAALPPGAPGSRGEVLLRLPPRSGRHDLCFTFTGLGFDPTPAIHEVRLGRAAAP